MRAALAVRGAGVVGMVALLLAPSAPAPGRSGLPPAHRSGLLVEGPGRVVPEEAWAERLVEALGLGDRLPADATPADVFDVLCPVSTGMRVATVSDPVPLEPAPGRGPERVFRSPALAPGRYQLAVHGRGAGLWSASGAPIGVLAPGALRIDVTSRPVQLAGGGAEIAVRLADGGEVERAEVAPSVIRCIAPEGGWMEGRALTFGAKARTMVQALDALARLPREGEVLRTEAEDFDAASGDGARTDRRLEAPASGDRWVLAVGDAAEFAWTIELPRPGLYSVLARVHGSGRQIWSLDGAVHAAVGAGEDAPRFAWSEVTTVWLEAGTHQVRARVPRGAGIDVVQVLQRRTDDDAFLAALGSLGLVEGDADAVVRERAARDNLVALEKLLLADGSGVSGLASAEGQLEDLYRRPLSPILPGDL